MLSIRRMTLGSGYRYLMESVAAGDGVRHQSTSLADYYAAVRHAARECSSAPAWLPSMAAEGSRSAQRSASNICSISSGCAPIRSAASRWGARRSARDPHWPRDRRDESGPSVLPSHAPGGSSRRPVTKPEVRALTATNRTPVAGFDLTFSPSKSISTAWALADADTKATIYACHRRAIEVVLTYAEREVFHSRSGRNGVVQEDVEGVVATAFTHWDSRAGDPQLHDHVVVANRARSVSDGAWRTLDSRGLFKSVVMLGELHQGVLADLLTQELGWDWDERSRRHSEQVRWEVAGVPETLHGRVLATGRRHRGAQGGADSRVRRRPWAPADHDRDHQTAPAGDPRDPAASKSTAPSAR